MLHVDHTRVLDALKKEYAREGGGMGNYVGGAVLSFLAITGRRGGL